MSNCFLEAVTSLILRENQLSGHLTPQFGEFESLYSLDLGRNSISGMIPTNIGKLSSLVELRLDHNKLNGNLPESIGQLYNLGFLDIEHNMLEGMVTESHFSNLSELTVLYASGNSLSLRVSPDWVPPFKLYTLELGSWDLGVDNIPLWIDTQILIYLTRGQIPDIRGPEESPRLVYLSSNQFSGSLPRIANTATELDLSYNSFTTGLSYLLCDTTNQTYRLEILHLGGNQLNEELPDCMMKWPSLIMLNLADNNLFGNVPNSLRFPASLLSINLHGNKFSGQIPFSVHNCTNLLKRQ